MKNVHVGVSTKRIFKTRKWMNLFLVVVVAFAGTDAFLRVESL